jgi:hypothetical protein
LVRKERHEEKYQDLLTIIIIRHFILSETDGVLSCFLVLEKIHKGKFGLHKMIHTAFTFKIVDHNGKELVQQNRKLKVHQYK